MCGICGLVSKRPYQEHPPRHEYDLTPSGVSLLPVLQAISRWGNRNVPGTWKPPKKFMKRKVK